MISNKAWQRHGCYSLGSEQYFNMPLGKAHLGCYDDWNSLDHFDPTTDSYRVFSRFHQLRSTYGALQDGFNLVQRGNWTYYINRPGSNNTATEMGLWSVSRAAIPNVQKLVGNNTDQVWLLYTNENRTRTWEYDCKDEKLWMSSPYPAGTTVRNLLAPYESYVLAESLSSYNNDGKAPFTGCMSTLTTQPYGFLALVPDAEWVGPTPALTGFQPGHDTRIHAESTDANATTTDIVLEFNMPMNCDSVTQSITFQTAASDNGSKPTISGTPNCAAIQNPVYSQIVGADASFWSWSATLQNVPDGIIQITVTNPTATSGGSTGVSTLVFRTCRLSDGLS